MFPLRPPVHTQILSRTSDCHAVSVVRLASYRVLCFDKAEKQVFLRSAVRVHLASRQKQLYAQDCIVVAHLASFMSIVTVGNLLMGTIKSKTRCCDVQATAATTLLQTSATAVASQEQAEATAAAAGQGGGPQPMQAAPQAMVAAVEACPQSSTGSASAPV